MHLTTLVSRPVQVQVSRSPGIPIDPVVRPSWASGASTGGTVFV